MPIDKIVIFIICHDHEEPESLLLLRPGHNNEKICHFLQGQRSASRAVGWLQIWAGWSGF